MCAPSCHAKYPKDQKWTSLSCGGETGYKHVVSKFWEAVDAIRSGLVRFQTDKRTRGILFIINSCIGSVKGL